MKKVFFVIQILVLTILFSGGNRAIEAGNMNMPSFPSQARTQEYYSQLAQNGNQFMKDHTWLKNGDNFIQVGISYFMVAAIGNGVGFIVPDKEVDAIFFKGDLLAVIEGVGGSGSTNLYAPCAGVIKGINPLIENPSQMAPNQVWVYKCHLKRDQLGPLMDDQQYAASL